jgi:GTP-binding protein
LQFVDLVTVSVQAGDGGDGITAFRREKYVPAGGPSGGNGGHGGSVIFLADANLQTLLDFRFQQWIRAELGSKGGPNNRTGASGSDTIVKVPCGTLVYDAETQAFLGDLTEAGETLVVAKGGAGGMGNAHFLSNHNRAPQKFTRGKPGEKRILRLELKLIAEVGIIGLPNAGKSTLLSVISAARPKVADYPFTTLVPNLGVVRRPLQDGVVFADIPGLIEGAHLGVGLGHDFLRHVERTRVLIHLVDASASDPITDYLTIQQELQAYGHGLPEKPQLLVVNKADILEPETLRAVITTLRDQAQASVYSISAVTGMGLDPMLQAVWQMLDHLKHRESLATQEVIIK